MSKKNEKNEMVEEVKEMEMKEMEMKEEKEMMNINFEEVMEVLRNMEMGNEEKKELRSFVKTLKLEKGEDGGRKKELVEILEREGRMGIKGISEVMGVSCKNVSSLLLYLKKEGYKICTDSEGRKFIEK